MDIFKNGMKGPSRPAPSAPKFGVNRYSPVTNWNDDPFGADVFEPLPPQKKKPPPRPPPPKIRVLPDIPNKPSHFIRKPTILSSIMTKKTKSSITYSSNSTQHSVFADYDNEVDATKLFSKCEPKNVNTGTLIDLSSPPSSPTFTTRSSSDGLSVDSFNSDATSSTQHHFVSGGNASQAESGFEDDFDLGFNKHLTKEDTFDDFKAADPFSPPPANMKPPLLKKPVLNKEYLDQLASKTSMNGPTIIRAKPARPKPPDSVSMLKSTFGNTMPVLSMNVNTSAPLQKIGNGFTGNYESKPYTWDDASPERESSPPMPSIPPPPPPQLADLDAWPSDVTAYDLEPSAVALFDYNTGHPDDLSFTVGDRIKLERRIDAEWLYGSANGLQGLFPANYVEIKVPLSDEKKASLGFLSAEKPSLGVAVAMYDFEPTQPEDLRLRCDDRINVLYKVSEEWYFGECCGQKGQFPSNYVQFV